SPKKLWFKSLSAFMTAVTLYFLCGRELAEAATAQRRAQLTAENAAANLGIDVEQITNPDAWLAKEKRKAERKREAALQEMRRFTHADEQESQARAAKAEAQRVIESEPDYKLRRELAKGIALRIPKDKLKANLVKLSPKLGEAIQRNARRPHAVEPESKPKAVGEHLKPPQFAPPSPRSLG